MRRLTLGNRTRVALQSPVVVFSDTDFVPVRQQAITWLFDETSDRILLLTAC